MLDLKDVGAFPAAPTAAGVAVKFGIYLPGIDASRGLRRESSCDRQGRPFCAIDFDHEFLSEPRDGLTKQSLAEVG